MEKILSVAQVVTPIFLTIFFGLLARRKKLMTPEENRGLQQFVMKFGLPCVVFNSCLTADMGLESLSSMAMVIPVVLGGTLWAFRARRKRFPHHNLPMLFAAQETGMLGIPLYMILFGAGEAYRMGVLDLAQAVAAYPVIALLTSDAGENLSPVQIAKKVVTSPLVICCGAGLFLNLTGIFAWMNALGIGAILTECLSFLSQPISAMMIFSVGFNFSLAEGNRGEIFKICGIHFGLYAVACGLIQLALFLVPGVDALTRWVLLLYCALPTSYLSTSMGRSEKDFQVASGVCSVSTLICLLVFCVMTVVVA